MNNNLVKEYIMVGGYPSKDKEQHPGGQVTATRLLAEYAEFNNIKLHIIDTSQQHFPIPSFNVRLNKARKRILEVRSISKKNNIAGVIIFSASGFSFYEKVLMSLLVRLKNIPSMLFIRSGHFINLNNRNKFLKFFNKLLLKIPTKIVAQGTKWIEFYEEMGVPREKINLIPNWIKIDKSSFLKKENKKVVFFFAGWIVEKKGVLELFDVIEDNKEFNNYIFRFAGGGTLLNELIERKKKNNLHNIELLGWVDQAKMKDEYLRSDVFILPSHAEGFPNSILEAIHYELPVISTNVGGISDSVINDYNGFTCEPKDKESLVIAIRKLGSSKDLREIFSKNSENILREKHDFFINCKKVFDSFEGLK